MNYYSLNAKKYFNPFKKMFLIHIHCFFISGVLYRRVYILVISLSPTHLWYLHISPCHFSYHLPYIHTHTHKHTFTCIYQHYYFYMLYGFSIQIWVSSVYIFTHPLGTCMYKINRSLKLFMYIQVDKYIIYIQLVQLYLTNIY